MCDHIEGWLPFLKACVRRMLRSVEVAHEKQWTAAVMSCRTVRVHRPALVSAPPRGAGRLRWAACGLRPRMCCWFCVACGPPRRVQPANWGVAGGVPFAAFSVACCPPGGSWWLVLPGPGPLLHQPCVCVCVCVPHPPSCNKHRRRRHSHPFSEAPKTTFLNSLAPKARKIFFHWLKARKKMWPSF